MWAANTLHSAVHVQLSDSCCACGTQGLLYTVGRLLASKSRVGLCVGTLPVPAVKCMRLHGRTEPHSSPRCGVSEVRNLLWRPAACLRCSLSAEYLNGCFAIRLLAGQIIALLRRLRRRTFMIPRFTSRLEAYHVGRPGTESAAHGQGWPLICLHARALWC